MRYAGNFHPEWGYIAPAPSFARMLRIVGVAVAVGATAGAAVVLTLVDRPSAANLSVSARTLASPERAPASVQLSAPTANAAATRSAVTSAAMKTAAKEITGVVPSVAAVVDLRPSVAVAAEPPDHTAPTTGVPSLAGAATLAEAPVTSAVASRGVLPSQAGSNEILQTEAASSGVLPVKAAEDPAPTVLMPAAKKKVVVVRKRPVSPRNEYRMSGGWGGGYDRGRHWDYYR